jgi:hypothetical protein
MCKLNDRLIDTSLHQFLTLGVYQSSYSKIDIYMERLGSPSGMFRIK